MNMYFVWPLWFLSIIVATISSFGVLEDYALRTGRPTLSRFVWELTASQPWVVILTVAVVAFVLGFLSCHFWWGGMISFAPVKKWLGG